MLVGGAMSGRVVSVQPTDTVETAVELMRAENVGSVVVCSEGRLLGIFTERDLLRLATERDFVNRRIGDVMTKNVITVAPDDEIVAAAHLMQKHLIRHLPVVEGGNVVGVFGIREAMRTLIERLWSDHDPDARATAQALLRRTPSPSAQTDLPY
jgi:CBS domain-containing protein